MSTNMSKTQIKALPTLDLVVIVNGTDPEGDLAWQLVWAREELERRRSNERDALIEADEKGNYYLAAGNEAEEAGEHKKAERLYAKGQKWLDRSNELRGNA